MAQLTREEFKVLTTLVLSLYEDGQRRALLRGLPRGWTATLPVVPAPMFQLLGDLRVLDETPVLADGMSPLLVWLGNVVDLAEQIQMSATAELRRLRDTAAQRAQVGPSLSLPPPRSGDEIVIHTRDYLAPSFFTAALSRVRAVARLVVPRFFDGWLDVDGSGAPRPGSGTGWLIAPGLLLTNQHVVHARSPGEPACGDEDLQQQVAGTTVSFDHDGVEVPTTERRVAQLVAHDKDLDYALLRLERSDPERGFFAEAASLRPGQAANIIHHPFGATKQLTIRNNHVHRVEGAIIQYFTCTDAGSSGAPVCDDEWRVIGLHRRWQEVNGVRFQGRDTLYVNEGSTLLAIRADLIARDVWDQVMAARGG